MSADETLHRAALHNSVDPWVLIKAVRDDDGKVVDFTYSDLNRAAAAYRGLSREEYLASTVLGTMPDVVNSGLFDLLVDCVETGEPLLLDDFAYRALTANGSVSPDHRFELRAVRVGAEHVSATWRDVNTRFQTVRQVAESEERYRLLAENISDVVVHVRNLVVVWVSSSVLGSFGAPPEFWIGQPVAKFLVPDDLPVLADLLDQTATGETMVRRLRLRDANGVPHWTEVHAKLFHDAAGNPDGRTATLHIIDAEVAAEEALEAARREQANADARYRKLIDHSVVATSLNTPEGRFTVVNKAMCEFFGYDAATLLTKTWQELTPAQYLEQDIAADADIVAGRRDSYRRTKEYIRANGELVWGDLSLSCIRTADGEVESMICQIVDITAEMRAQEQLVASEELNRVLAQDLQCELSSAARYLRSALPVDLEGPLSAQSRYVPSSILGGDFFDFRWVDDDHLIVYLLDVSGHGVQSALVAVSAYNLLRSSTVTTPNLLHPSQVLGALNRHFAMEIHNGNYFTIWYGVYEKSTRTLRYASGGHPPAILAADGKVVALPGTSPPVGMFEETTFPAAVVPIPAGSQLLIYSDGAYELDLADGGHWSHAEFVDVCADLARSPGWSLDDLIGKLLSRSGTGSFTDDCSLVMLTFD